MTFHPLVREWFSRRLGEPTRCQALAWPEIRTGSDVLVTAPTGSGKTLAAFLICVDGLIRKALDGTIQPATEVVYVSPLKALSNDVQKNLEAPLAEIAALAVEQGIEAPAVTTAVRTGDTPQAERQKAVRRPPHILVTTPESLYILLTSESGRRALRTVKTVIVDEIHAVVDDKRGAHLALSLARLDDLVAKAGGARPQRIGLSATVHPIAEVANYLSGVAEGCGPVRIIDTGHRRTMDLAIEVPRDELGGVASNEMWGEIYDRIAALINEHRTTLVFVNTRRLAERIAHHLTTRLGEEAVLAHHGSLSRKLRLTAEQRLKSGELRAVVATASLELGIDIGSVDLAIQVGSPRSIAVLLQRVGRSGHMVDRPGRSFIPKGRLFATTRDELLECAALVRAARTGALDRLEFPSWPLDVLAQQIVAAAASEDWAEDDLFDLVRRCWPYRELPRKDFDAVVEMLSDGITTRRGRSGTFLHRDLVNKRVRGRRGARLAAITSGGAIPDNASYFVVAEPEGTVVGTLDEDFAVESLAGDVFLLGTTSWRIRRVEPGRVRVEDAHGAAPSVPFWRGEAPGRTDELSKNFSGLLQELERALFGAAVQAPGRRPDAEAVQRAVDILMRDCGLDRRGAEQAAEYVGAGIASLGALPSMDCVVAERFFDESGGMQLVIHAPFGARVNRAWGLALRKRFCRSFNFELQAAATDNGIVISLSDQHSFPLEIIYRFLNVNTVEDVLTQAMLDAPMFTARWRWNASRALAILRFAGGRKVPPPIQRMRSDDLLAAVFPDQVACAENLVGEIRIPDHPLVFETIRDCLHEAMDLDALKALLAGIDSGAIRTVAIDTAEPSPFSHEILNANPYAYLDDAPLEERRARAVQMRRSLGPDAADIGALDPAAISLVAEESWPVIRDRDELHDALLTLISMPPAEQVTDLFEELRATRRATTLRVDGESFWVAAERLQVALTAYPGAALDPPIDAVGPVKADSREQAAAEILRGWLESSGPTTAAAIGARLALPRAVVEAGLGQLESEGQILRGRFTSAAVRPDSDIEWCNRRILARIHRLTLGRLRREVEPVTSAEFMRFLTKWQHVAPGTLLHGPDGLLQVIRQLQGYEISAAHWEPQILTRRVSRYGPELLEQLCLSGEVMWGRLSPLNSRVADEEESAVDAERNPGRQKARRIRPTRVAPLAIFLREDADWLLSLRQEDERDRAREAALSPAAQAVLEALRARGASFLADLARILKAPMAQVEDGLWELASAGIVTADAFDNMRALINPVARRDSPKGRFRLRARTAGRWALLRDRLQEAAETDESAGRLELAAASGPNGRPAGAVSRPDGGTEAARTRAVEAFARQLLLRWGVVFRDLLARESLAPPWRDLLVTLRRMEARGEIRGGRFVSGPAGEQFARIEAIELLRAVRRTEATPEVVRISAADPLNLAGIVTPGTRTSPLDKDAIHLRSGVPDAQPLTLGRGGYQGVQHTPVVDVPGFARSAKGVVH